MSINSKLSSFPFHSFGIVIFFLTHGYSENAGLISFGSLIRFGLGAMVVSGLLLLLFKRWFGHITAAGLAVTSLLLIYLFYGAFQDGLRSTGLASLSRYRVLLTACVVFLVAVYLYLRRHRGAAPKTTRYLNLLFILLIVVDLGSITVQTIRKPSPRENSGELPASLFLQKIPSGARPDIYLLVMDEYCGTETLHQYFNYDNSWFIDWLQKKGFYVAAHPQSNYTSTALSIASLFNLNYLEWLPVNQALNAEVYVKAAKTIGSSPLIHFLQSAGYQVKNFSIFDVQDQLTPFSMNILPLNLGLITAKTLSARMERDILWILRARAPYEFRWLAKKFQDQYKKRNEDIVSLTRAEPEKKMDGPRFVYSHFVMPHAPFIYDSLGHELFVDPTRSPAYQDSCYLQYHVYATKLAQGLIENIRHHAPQAIIIFQSDHGYRTPKPAPGKTLSGFNSFYSILLPVQSHQAFYDSISMVNQFRITLNAVSGQQLPVLKDSAVHTFEPHDAQP